MIHVIHCLDCDRYFDEDDLETKTVDLEEEYGVGGLFPDHHRKKIAVCSVHHKIWDMRGSMKTESGFVICCYPFAPKMFAT